MRKRTSLSIIAVLTALVLCGCSGGDSESPAPPAYDLTGEWQLAGPMDCEASGSADDVTFELSISAAEMGDEVLHIVQTGDNLTLTAIVDTATEPDEEETVHGTIAGSRFSAALSEQVTEEGVELDLFLEIEGTVLDADRIAMTHEATLAWQEQGETATLVSSCAYSLTRVEPGV